MLTEKSKKNLLCATSQYIKTNLQKHFLMNEYPGTFLEFMMVKGDIGNQEDAFIELDFTTQDILIHRQATSSIKVGNNSLQFPAIIDDKFNTFVE